MWLRKRADVSVQRVEADDIGWRQRQITNRKNKNRLAASVSGLVLQHSDPQRIARVESMARLYRLHCAAEGSDFPVDCYARHGDESLNRLRLVAPSLVKMHRVELAHLPCLRCVRGPRVTQTFRHGDK